MKVIAINGGPRKTWNTATLLKSALDGAASLGAETEMTHLYDLSYRGCISCFSCKLDGGKSYGKCALQDDLTPVFEKIEKADALLMGSPVYLGDVTGALRSFLERLVFQYLVYDKKQSTLLKKTIPVGLIYTMNVDEDNMTQAGYKQYFQRNQDLMTRIFGPAESLYVTNTLQFPDYSKYVNTIFDSQKKTKRHHEIFPQDCKKAYELGKRLLQNQSQ
ncbi:flavodoxin family protein [Clostridium sp. JNZ X4-2]